MCSQKLDILTSFSNTKKGYFLFLLICLIGSSVSISFNNHHNQHHLNHNLIHHFKHQISSHHQQSIYDQGEYLAKLAQTQNKFKTQILDIQSDFVSINQMLNDSNLNDGQKKMKLQQALADERDSLRDIQNSLNVPYALKSCQCLDLNQQQKKDFSLKLDTIGKKINQLQKQIKEAGQNCSDPNNCPLTNQLRQEITIMTNYQTIMQNTISSQCCKIVKRAYKDNLDTNNWHFGNTTSQQYQSQLFKRQQIQKVTLVPCSYIAPFVDANNSCFSCPDTKPLFNLGSRQCEKDCTQSTGNQAYVLNLTTHTCGYNKNCPTNQYFDMSLLRCVATPNYYNDSSCPPQKPYWDSKSLSCSYCLSQTPYYDVILKKCRSCYQNQTWNQASEICQGEVKCAIDQVYNSATNTCTKKQQSGSHSLCPPDRPYWDQLNFSCDTCPTDKPYFDPSKLYCRACNLNEVFNVYTSICQSTSNKSCLNGQYYSNITKRCELTGTTSMCPPSTPFWDSQSYKCLKCPSITPVFNEKIRKCQSCPLNTTWQQNQQTCTLQCALDQVWDPTYKKCLKKNRLCQPKSAFSIVLNKCVEINCSIDMPYWNLATSQCETCPQYTIYNAQNNICQKDSRYGNVSVCQIDKPIWNSQILRCQPCPSQTQWNSAQSQCIAINTHHNHHQSLFEFQEHNENKIYGHVYGTEKISFQHRIIAPSNS